MASDSAIRRASRWVWNLRLRRKREAPENEHEEGVWPRAYRTWEDFCARVPFLLTDGVISIVVTGQVGVVVGLLVFLGLFGLVFLGAWARAITGQRDEARTALRAIVTARAYVESITHDGRGRDILLPANGGPGISIVEVVIRTGGHNITGGMFCFDVPERVGLELCDQHGTPEPVPPKAIQVANGRRWHSAGCEFPGSRTAVVAWFKLTLHEEGEIKIFAKVKYDGSPGWIETPETFQVVRPQP